VPRASPFFRPALIFTALLLASSFALRVLPLAAESAHSVPPGLETALVTPWTCWNTPWTPQKHPPARIATSDVACAASGGSVQGRVGQRQHAVEFGQGEHGFGIGSATGLRLAASTRHSNAVLSWPDRLTSHMRPRWIASAN
jgi:hypothetical protein